MCKNLLLVIELRSFSRFDDAILDSIIIHVTPALSTVCVSYVGSTLSMIKTMITWYFLHTRANEKPHIETNWITEWGTKLRDASLKKGS